MKSLYSFVAMICAIAGMMLAVVGVMNAMFILCITFGTPICWLTGRPINIGIVDGLSELAQYSILLMAEIVIGFAFAGMGTLVEKLDDLISHMRDLERQRLYRSGGMGR